MRWIPPQYNFFIGVDVGYVHDRTAVSIIERALWASAEEVEEGWAWRGRVQEEGWCWPHEIHAKAVAAGAYDNATRERPPYPPLLLRRLEQFRGRRQEDELIAFLKRAINHPEI